ncbi:YuzD family protein [Salinicoccus sesuvii]|uniref:YuzD family protein n=1 Tax=Salinicoccus sesuvii TaxID=868281 RepID=A0ABV7N6P9_9STAP
MKYVINVYGRDVVCASCVNAPGSKDTYEWLEAVLARKYPTEDLNFNYIDIDRTDNLSDFDESIIERINEDELFYPLVTINDEIAQDGHVQLKPIQRMIEKQA